MQSKPVFGPATFFVSTSYSHKFDELVAAIWDHYLHLPDTSATGYAPVYYWISAFAVNMNHSHDIRKNPDSAFEPVIHRCRALLLACKSVLGMLCLYGAFSSGSISPSADRPSDLQ